MCIRDRNGPLKRPGRYDGLPLRMAGKLPGLRNGGKLRSLSEFCFQPPATPNSRLAGRQKFYRADLCSLHNRLHSPFRLLFLFTLFSLFSPYAGPASAKSRGDTVRLSKTAPDCRPSQTPGYRLPRALRALCADTIPIPEAPPPEGTAHPSLSTLSLIHI